MKQLAVTVSSYKRTPESTQGTEPAGLQFDPSVRGVVEPTIAHEVETKGDVRFFLEFYR